MGRGGKVVGNLCREVGLAEAKPEVSVLGGPPISQKLSDFHASSPMSLYYEAAAILANADNTGGSLKSRIYKKKDLKSTPGQLFALIAETSKWSVVLKDVIDSCGLLAEEKKVP